MNFMTESYFGKDGAAAAIEALHKNLGDSIAEYEESGYPYDFYITSVSVYFPTTRRQIRRLSTP